MISASRLALRASATLGVAVFISTAVQDMVRHSAKGVSPFAVPVAAAAEGLLLGGIVWVGTYIGARLSTPS
jgi:hypothetical protein